MNIIIILVISLILVAIAFRIMPQGRAGMFFLAISALKMKVTTNSITSSKWTNR